ncbi:MAG: metal-dependent transcriptional regulator [Burkholderiaceae bacterium]|nr:metal-dependent transcriptional regulator [Microbacteriaceae bacterium]
MRIRGADAAGGSAIEDYVKVIYAHTEWQDEPITPTVLASRLGLAASSVTEMVKKLAVAGLVTHVPYGAVTLTANGTALALRMVRRHRLIETWLVESFGYGWDEVHDEADVLEHAVSDRLLEKIADQLGDPRRDPHGDPIPDRDGVIALPDAVLLLDAADGATGTVVRISDRDPELLRYLGAERLLIDTDVTVVGRRPFGGALAVCIGGSGAGARELDLGDGAAASIWISTAVAPAR